VKVPPFRLERYFAEHEFNAPFLLCCSDCESLTVKELLALEPGAMEGLQDLWLGYTESQGGAALRQRIAGLYNTISPEDILVHAGAEEAIFNFMNVTLERGDHVIVHAPCYQSLSDVAASIGCQVTEWKASRERDWELDLDVLRKNLKPHTKAVIINCPHNPTGYLMDRETFQELVRLSREHGFIIFSDEVYRGLEYLESDRLPALCDVDERGVSLGVMSKSFGLAGLRIGWIATRNADLRRKMAAFKDYTTICSSAPSEYLATVALKHADFLISRNLRIIGGNLQLLDAFFERNGTLFRWVPPKAGPLAFPGLSDAVNVEAFCRDVLQKAGVLLLPGTIFGKEYNHFRIGFGRANLPECIEKFEDYLNRYRPRG
jgi:aspartate/methionine/tyrosine aminotransferase